MKLAHAVPILALTLLPAASCAAEPALDAARRQLLVRRTIEHVRANYVHPARAESVAAALRAWLGSGNGAPPATPDEFLEALNRDLQRAANDRHLQVIRNPRIAAQLRREADGREDPAPGYLAMLEGENFRLRRVESLDGNVGYFRFDNFVEWKYVREAFTGAMDFLHASSAIVLDLRENGGGAAETSDLLVSYFLPEGTRTGESWNRPANTTTPSIVRTAPGVRPMLDTPLYILVGERTASAAEAVAYTLQQAGRATVVGSRTRGMANAGQHFPLDDEHVVMVPTILNRNAVTGTNWEGVGVAPDVVVEPEQALDAAMAAALRALAGRRKDPQERSALRFAAEAYEARLSPEAPPAGFLEACLGRYDADTRIENRAGTLWFVQGHGRRRMSFLRDHTFAVEGRSDYRLRFPVEGGRVTRCEVLWFDDTSETRKRVS